ncbi:MAG TPA: cytochrome c oxidase subunit II [Bacilli bacterium]|nr:cytochrome c oxidase subunit II [Bacilli bacterium]
MESIFQMPDALTSTAHTVDSLFNIILIITAIVFVLVESLLVIFLIRYKRKNPDKQGRNIHGNNTAEVIWTLIPAIILVLIGIYSASIVYDVQTPPDDVYTIKVYGKKWQWDFQYENGAKTYGELRIPEGKNVMFKIYSEDVIHSFWVPQFRMKQDAVPGRETTYWINASDIPRADGKYEKAIKCAEYCGNAHSKMYADLVIMPSDQFDTWVAEELTRKKTDAQSVIAENGCASCHSIDGSKGAGPSWKGIFGTERKLNGGKTVKVDEEYIKESILDPGAKVADGFQAGMMPQYTLEDEQVANLVKYIEELK